MSNQETTIRIIIGQVEAATEASRDLDAAIAETIGRPRQICIGDGIITPQRWVPLNLLRYTASLDAALTLVPEGTWWVAGFGRRTKAEPLGGAAIYYSTGLAMGTLVAEAEAATPALALCAAALRARLIEIEPANAG